MSRVATWVPGALGWLVGPAMWVTVFLVVYASESLVCTRLGRGEPHTAIVLTVALPAILAIAIRLSRGPCQDPHGARSFLSRTGRVLDWLSLLGVGWVALMALVLPACAG